MLKLELPNFPSPDEYESNIFPNHQPSLRMVWTSMNTAAPFVSALKRRLIRSDSGGHRGTAGHMLCSCPCRFFQGDDPRNNLTVFRGDPVKIPFWCQARGSAPGREGCGGRRSGRGHGPPGGSFPHSVSSPFYSCRHAFPRAAHSPRPLLYLSICTASSDEVLPHHGSHYLNL